MVLTKKQVLNEFTNVKGDDLFCAFCYNILQKVNEKLYCPNEHCDCNREYNLKGEELKDE